MTDCSKIPTLGLVEESKKAMEDVVDFAGSPETTYVSELDGSTKKTIQGITEDALESFRVGAAIHQGDYAVGVTYDEPNWTYTYNGQQWGLSSDFDLSTLPYEATFADPNDDSNLAVRGEASQEWVAENFLGNSDGMITFETLSDVISGNPITPNIGDVICITGNQLSIDGSGGFYLVGSTKLSDKDVTITGIGYGNYIEIDASKSSLQELIVTSLTKRKKPDISVVFEDKFKEVMASPYHFYPSQLFGVTGDEIIFTPVKALANTSGIAPGQIMFLTEISNGDTYDFTINAESSTGITVDFVGSNSLDGNNTVITTGLTPTGDEYSVSGSSDGTYQYLGFKVRGVSTTLGETSRVKNLSLIVQSIEKADFNLIYSEHKGSSAASTLNFNSSVGQTIGDVYIRSYGVSTGFSPSVLWCSDSATPLDGTFSAFVTDQKGTLNNPACVNDALMTSEICVRDGFIRPVIILLQGNYDASIGGANAFIRSDRLNLTSSDPVYVISPFGESSITSGGVTWGLFSTETTTHNLYLWGLNFDNTFNLPILSLLGDLHAYQVKTNSGTADSWDIDKGDLIAQECEATGASNDGFNSHVYGHTILIDCKAYQNTDDGFSPHDGCTYEVWGGEYYENGKGNVIPAFGAQGFCIDVTSYGCLGTSPNVSEVNYGGFVCLSGVEQAGYENRATVMVLIDCSTDNDIYGINSAGQQSHLYVANASIENATQVGLSHNSWGVRTPGHIYELYGNTYSGNTSDRSITNVGRYKLQNTTLA